MRDSPIDRRLLRAPSPWRFLTVALLLPVALAGVLVWLSQEVRRAEVLRVRTAHAYGRHILLADTLSRLKDAETSQRGYLLTGIPVFLERYEPARRDVMRGWARLDEATLPATERRQIQQARDLTLRKFAEMDQTIADRRAGRVAVAVARISEGYGKRYMDQIRALSGAALTSQLDRVAAHRLAFTTQRARLAVVVRSVVIAMIVILLAGSWLLWQQRRARYHALVAEFEAARRNQTILDSTVDALLILNPSGTIEQLNAAATAMLGYPAPDLERHDIDTLLNVAPGHGSFHQRIGLVDGQLRQTFLPDRCARHRDGRGIPVDVALGVMDLPSGLHLVVSLRDISERKRLERMKDDLISTVSHEIRTPLTSVIGALGLLHSGSVGKMSADASRLIEIAESNSRRLIRLINDMLDIDRIESGKLEIAAERVDLREVVQTACNNAHALGSARQVAITCELPDAPIPVVGDADRLLQVVDNLLSNAVRLSPDGRPVTAGIHRDQQRALVTVDDEGPGVPAAFRDRIFGRFERAGDEGTSSGTGLGLAISREIVTRHGGEIWFEDRPAGGTRFIVSLPLSDPAAAHATAPRVLIGEHDAALATVLVRLATAEACSYDLVTSTTQVRAALETKRYQALILDLNLPTDGALTIAQELADEHRPTIPLVIVSGSPGSDSDVEAPGAGVLHLADWVSQSPDPDRLSQALRSALSATVGVRPCVLHLDDDADLREVVRAGLEIEADVLQASDLAEARAILQQVTPQVVILDVHLSRESGLDLLPFLSDAAGLPIPTIVYSAHELAPADGARVNAVLVKARDSLPDLKAAIRRVLSPDRTGPP